ncbi:MAG: class I SAM-dependent methyltransferase [Chloroflexota bacterium]|nr:class I SAM-dependent methyltransferase [Chloroflexota bacterium]
MKLLIVRLLYWLKGLFEDPNELLKALGVEEGDRVLEIGCAIGYHTMPLAAIASNGKVYAIEIWEEGLAHLKRTVESAKNIDVICQSAEAVDLINSSLDKIVCLDTLHDIPDREMAVKRWMAYLKEGGRLLYRDSVIPAEKIPACSEGKLLPMGTTKGVHIFTRQQ